MTGIGIAVGFDARSGQPLSTLRQTLDRVAEIGFTHAELSAKSLAVACGGTLLPPRLGALQAALDGVAIRLTVHGTNVSSARAGNLMDVTTPNQRRVAESDLALAAAIGAEVLVIHSGSLRDVYGDDDALTLAMTAERDSLRALGDQAGKHGIKIAVENIDPVGTYLARRAYGLRLDTLGEQVARVDHPRSGSASMSGTPISRPRMSVTTTYQRSARSRHRLCISTSATTSAGPNSTATST